MVTLRTVLAYCRPGRVSVVHLLPFLFVFGGAGCTSVPSHHESLNYFDRAETQVEDGVHVSAVVLNQHESMNSFDLPLASKGIQPVWIEIDNRENIEYRLMMLSLDPDYFSPSEVAWKFRSGDKIELNDRIEIMVDKHVPVIIPPRSVVSGYVFTNLDPGAKSFTVELVGDKKIHSFDFIQSVPGFEADYMRVDFDRLYLPEQVRDLDIDELRQYLESLPCCVAGGDRKTPGDPLNLVIVGDGANALATLVRRRWDLTETIRRDTVWYTVASSVFGLKYRTSPVSSLYLYERPQDVALQKARSNVDERNHLRLWLAPVTLNGKEVWVGQISRDIGIKLSSKTFVTHKIDPYVDEAREYVMQDVVASNRLQKLGFVGGVGYSDTETPAFNYTNDPYYTDGLRIVLILSEDPIPLGNIQLLHWR